MLLLMSILFVIDIDDAVPVDVVVYNANYLLYFNSSHMQSSFSHGT